MNWLDFSALQGLTLVSINVVRHSYDAQDEITFTAAGGRSFRMWHFQDCCESVHIEEIIGDLNDLLDTPIVVAEARSQADPNADESGTWTFYEIRTIKGSVTIRWYGSSNGYYSESVDFAEIDSE